MGTLSTGKGQGEGYKVGLLLTIALAFLGCGKDENSPDMGAVAPKPNPGVVANAPGGTAPSVPQPGVDAAAVGPAPRTP